MGTKYQYSRLDPSQSCDHAALGGDQLMLESLRSRRAFKDRFIGAICGLFAAIALFMTLYHFYLPAQRSTLPNMVEGIDASTGKPASWFSGECGRSASEARDRGCRFDCILHSWLPPACVYGEDFRDEEEFMNMSDWKYYRDPQRRSEIPHAEVFRGDATVVYTSFRWHLVHCTFVWKRLHRALTDGHNIDSYVANQNHTHHCSEILLLDVEPQREVTRIFTKFPTCG